MADIIRAEIVGIREAEQTRVGVLSGVDTTYNSTYYSILLFYNDGTRELVEGNARQISPYLRYIKPQNDYQEIEAIINKYKPIIQSVIQDAIHQEIIEGIKILHPLPNVIDKYEDEAKKILVEAGFVVEELDNYPPDIPPGIIESCNRKQGTLMTVQIRVRHDIPNVINKYEDEARKILAESGFIVEELDNYPPDIPPGIIESCNRKQGTLMTVQIRVRHDIPNVIGLTCEQAKERLQALGFTIKVRADKYFNCVDNQVISIDRAGKSMNAVIAVAKSISTLDGLSLNEAYSILKRSGIYITEMQKEYSDTIPIGEIIRTEMSNENSIKIYLSRGKYNNVWDNDKIDFRFDKLEDSTGGYINGSASFDREKEQLKIQLKICQFVKHRHEFKPVIDCFINDKKALYSFPSDYSLAKQFLSPDKNEMSFCITMRCDQWVLKGEELPERTSIKLYTTNKDLLNKNEDQLFIEMSFKE